MSSQAGENDARRQKGKEVFVCTVGNEEKNPRGVACPFGTAVWRDDVLVYVLAGKLRAGVLRSVRLPPLCC